MKHNFKITALLLAMFVITQFIGLYVINYYSAPDKELPLGMEPPPIQQETDYYSFFTGIIIAFVIAIVLLFLLTKFHFNVVLKIWFFVVVVIAMIISFNAIFGFSQYAFIIGIVLALPLAFFKLFRRSFIIHNLTELIIYPGIAAVFVPILNLWTIVILLILISAYDMWAVWHSGIMQKMAKYQIDNLKIFSGFFIPYLNKKVREQIAKLRDRKVSSSKISKKLEEKKVKVNIAILGGGDVIFPIITAGVVMSSWGFWPAVAVIIGATLGLTYLFLAAKKKRFYPAMPFITAGIFLGMIAGYLLWVL